MTSTIDRDEVERVAGKLPRAQRDVLRRLRSEWWSEAYELASIHCLSPAGSATALARKGLARRRYHLDPRPTEYIISDFGLAVRQYLLEQEQQS